MADPLNMVLGGKRIEMKSILVDKKRLQALQPNELDPEDRLDALRCFDYDDDGYVSADEILRGLERTYTQDTDRELRKRAEVLVRNVFYRIATNEIKRHEGEVFKEFLLQQAGGAALVLIPVGGLLGLFGLVVQGIGAVMSLKNSKEVSDASDNYNGRGLDSKSVKEEMIMQWVMYNTITGRVVL